MSRFDDFLSEEPSSSKHTENIMARATTELEKNQSLARDSRRRSLFGVFGLGLAAVAGLLLWNRQTHQVEAEMGLVAFADVDVESEDVEILASGEDDFLEFLETLEEEDWEES